jgi:coenzyme F420-reducing hydrogenase delta subunit
MAGGTLKAAAGSRADVPGKAGVEPPAVAPAKEAPPKAAAKAPAPEPVEGTPRPPPGWEPEIVAFCCTFCAYTAADLAGSQRTTYPTNVKIVKLLCTGKMDPIYILKAFESGADGVYVAGCLEGSCHFETGNYRARAQVERVKKMLEELKLDPGRLEMYNLSSAMGTRFAEIAREFTDRIRKLGPSPVPRVPCPAPGESGTPSEGEKAGG